MQQLHLPSFESRIRTSADGRSSEIFDVIRKKFVALTPEEWVRQHFVHYLNIQLGYPLSLISIERKLTYNGLTRRTDIVAYANDGKPKLIVECKAPAIKISQDVFDQAARYHLILPVPFLVLTNGLQHFCCTIDHEKQSYSFHEGIPSYKELL
jgi:hypothetical protein